MEDGINSYETRVIKPFEECGSFPKKPCSN
jgi:hypothetical protein